MNTMSLCVKHGSFRCVSDLNMSQSTQVKFPRGLALGSPLLFLTSKKEVALSCYVACSCGPFLIWTTECSPFQLFALFHLPFHCKFFLCQEVFLDLVCESQWAPKVSRSSSWWDLQGNFSNIKKINIYLMLWLRRMRNVKVYTHWFPLSNCSPQPHWKLVFIKMWHLSSQSEFVLLQ